MRRGAAQGEGVRQYRTTDELIAALVDLHKQATTERSHHYTASVIEAAIIELRCLSGLVKKRLDTFRKERNPK